MSNKPFNRTAICYDRQYDCSVFLTQYMSHIYFFNFIVHICKKKVGKIIQNGNFTKILYNLYFTELHE